MARGTPATEAWGKRGLRQVATIIGEVSHNDAKQKWHLCGPRQGYFQKPPYFRPVASSHVMGRNQTAKATIAMPKVMMPFQAKGPVMKKASTAPGR